jgi:hypothetical protein
MMRRLGRFALILALAVGGTVGFARVWHQGQPESSRTVRTPLLSAPSSALNLGEVWEDERFSWILPVKNHGSDPVHVADVRANCDCVSAEPRTFKVLPGQSYPLRLSINLTKRTEPSANGKRTFSTTIILTTRSEQAPTTRESISLSARVRPVLAVRPAAPEFGAISDAVSTPPSATFEVAAQTPLECLTAISETPGFEASALPAGSQSLDVFKVQVAATARPPVGPFEAVVRLVPLVPGGQPLPERTVRVRGVIAPDVAAVPRHVSAGARPVGDTAEEIVTVSSRTGRAVKIIAVAAHGDGLTAERLDNRRIRIRQTITHTGDVNGQMTLTVEPAGGPPVEAVVPVTGYGTEEQESTQRGAKQ